MTSDEYTRVVRLEAYEVELVSHLRDLMDPDLSLIHISEPTRPY